jgi:hypothetical protein
MRTGTLAGCWIFSVTLLIGLTGVCPAQTGADLWADEPGGQTETVELNREFIDQLLVQLDKEAPALAQQLRQWRKDDPFRFVLEIRRIALARNPKLARTPTRQTRPAAENSVTEPNPDQSGQWQKRIDEFMEWFKTAYPDRAKPLEELRKSDMESFLTQISSVRRRFEPVMRAEKRDPELTKVLRKDIELQDQCSELLAKLTKVEEKDRAQIADQLTKVVAAQFDIIIQKRRIQYATIETKIQQMKKEVDDQNKQLDQFLQKKDQLTRNRVLELTKPPAKPDKR